jgi:hypothetical protein
MKTWSRKEWLRKIIKYVYGPNARIVLLVEKKPESFD